MTDPDDCPLLAALVADHADIHRRPEPPEPIVGDDSAGRRAARETFREIDAHVRDRCATAYAIAQIRRSHGLEPSPIITPSMMYARFGEALANPHAPIGPRVHVDPGFVAVFKPELPRA